MHNKYLSRSASESDQEFILKLLQTRLETYNLHKRQIPTVRDHSEENFEQEYEPISSNDVEILNVYIVTTEEGKSVGAYKYEYDSFGKYYRLFWLAAIESVRGVGTFVMKEAKSFAKSKDCETIKLSVNLINHDAIKCYVNNGFAFDNKYAHEVEMTIKI